MIRESQLTDESHIRLARMFGDLDDVKPYVAAGRKNRLKYDELFDVSNVELDGTIVDPSSPRGQANKVRMDSAYLLYANLHTNLWRLGKRSISC